MSRRALFAIVVVTTACGGADPLPAPTRTTFGGDRPVTLHVPSSYDHATPTPLIVVLHGASVTGQIQLDYIGFDRLVDDYGALLVAPDGTLNSAGVSHWDIEGNAVDDAGYITGLIDEVSGVYNVDPARVHLFGHSNGATFAYALACDHSDRIASILPLAHGPRLAAPCPLASPVSVLHMHGDADAVVPYDGFQGFRGAVASVDLLAAANGCATSRTHAAPVDVDATLPGAETTVEITDDCPTGIDVELWTIRDGSHVPDLPPTFADQAWTFFSTHPKPAGTP